MCEKCVRYVKNNRPRHLKPGLARIMAEQILRYKYMSVPLFRDKADNLLIEAEVYKLRRRRTRRMK